MNLRIPVGCQGRKIIQFAAHAQMQRALLFNHEEPNNDQEGRGLKKKKKELRAESNLKQQNDSLISKDINCAFKRLPKLFVFSLADVSISSLFPAIATAVNHLGSRLVEVNAARPGNAHRSLVVDLGRLSLSFLRLISLSSNLLIYIN